jgi:DNA polymerase-3 subunit epsilon
MPHRGFAIIDFETTGLFPGGHDRVVEIAVVHTDEFGVVQGQWDTLVNPGRDLGPQHIHRIRALEVLQAPTFAQIAPRLVELLSGRILVAHNANFDVRFLRAELVRADYAVPAETAYLCTMQLAREFLPGTGRSLKDCCDAYDIEIHDAHRALADAIATAQLLQAYLEEDPTWAGWKSASNLATEWPRFSGASLPWVTRETANADRAESFLERITVSMPEHVGPEEEHDYLALLDRCLLDRDISVHESNALVHFAESRGISRTTCNRLNSLYFTDLTAVAWADGVLEIEEIADLTAVAQLLNISPLALVDAMTPPVSVTASADSLDRFSLQAGDLIVLTGDMQRSREDWHEDLRSYGFIPWGSVTKKVRLLVAADADSVSGKARKARDYNIAVVDEAGLRRLLGTASKTSAADNLSPSA